MWFFISKRRGGPVPTPSGGGASARGSIIGRLGTLLPPAKAERGGRVVVLAWRAGSFETTLSGSASVVRVLRWAAGRFESALRGRLVWRWRRLQRQIGLAGVLEQERAEFVESYFDEDIRRPGRIERDEPDFVAALMGDD